MKLKKTIFLLIILFTNIALFAEVKIGYIFSEEIMKKFEDARQVEIDLEKESRKLQQGLLNLQSEYDSLGKDFERTKLLMSDSRRESKLQELSNMEQKMQRYQMEKFGPDGEIYRIQAQLLSPVLAKLDEIIREIANERGYDFIFDANGAGILFSLDNHNVTEDVLEKLRKADKIKDD